MRTLADPRFPRRSSTRHRIRPWLRAVGVGSALVLCLASSACFGRFELVRKVYAFNKRVDPDKWIQWGAFLVMNFVPVYGAAAFVDAVFANSVEFWTGQNPITADAVHRSTGPNGEIATLTLHPDGFADFELLDADGARHALRLGRESDAIAAYTPDGELLGRVTSRDGRIVRLDP